MILRFLCNAGICIEYGGKVLLVDLPNSEVPPFHSLSEDEWQRICAQRTPYSDVCGFFFTHEHGDHLDRKRLQIYIETHPDTYVFVPDMHSQNGTIALGTFCVEYQRFDHAPYPQAPPHVVALVTVGEKTVYISADAELDDKRHLEILNGRKIDAAIWTPMYLSRETTRKLFRCSSMNYIYHMPTRSSGIEIWKKCEKNLERYRSELNNVVVIDQYPTTVTV